MKRMRLFRFSVRQLLILVAIIAILATLLVRSWHRTQARRTYLDNAGAVGGHKQRIQGYQARRNRSSVSGILFNDTTVMQIKLYPGSYDDTDLDEIRALFPEATITDYQPQQSLE